MQANIVVQGVNDSPQLANLKTPIYDYTNIETMTFCLIERGMASGEPSVIFVVSDDEGSVCLQTSLDKFLMSAIGLMAMAESRFQWKRPEGYATLLPMTKEQRKDLLEAMVKELREWEEVDESDPDINS